MACIFSGSSFLSERERDISTTMSNTDVVDNKILSISFQTQV
jgi:hypothetical protein